MSDFDVVAIIRRSLSPVVDLTPEGPSWEDVETIMASGRHSRFRGPAVAVAAAVVVLVVIGAVALLRPAADSIPVATTQPTPAPTSLPPTEVPLVKHNQVAENRPATRLEALLDLETACDYVWTDEGRLLLVWPPEAEPDGMGSVKIGGEVFSHGDFAAVRGDDIGVVGTRSDLISSSVPEECREDAGWLVVDVEVLGSTRPSQGPIVVFADSQAYTQEWLDALVAEAGRRPGFIAAELWEAGDLEGTAQSLLIGDLEATDLIAAQPQIVSAEVVVFRFEEGSDMRGFHQLVLHADGVAGFGLWVGVSVVATLDESSLSEHALTLRSWLWHWIYATVTDQAGTVTEGELDTAFTLALNMTGRVDISRADWRTIVEEACELGAWDLEVAESLVPGIRPEDEVMGGAEAADEAALLTLWVIIRQACPDQMPWTSLTAGMPTAPGQSSVDEPSVTAPSQAESEAIRDGVHPHLALLPIDRRVERLTEVDAEEGTWVLARAPAGWFELGDPEGIYGVDRILAAEYGEVLLFDTDGSIDRAFPMPGLVPSWIYVDDDAVYAGHIGDGALPDAALLRIDRRTFELAAWVMRPPDVDRDLVVDAINGGVWLNNWHVLTDTGALGDGPFVAIGSSDLGVIAGGGTPAVSWIGNVSIDLEAIRQFFAEQN